MINIFEARRLISENIEYSYSGMVTIDRAVGRNVAEDIYSKINLPQKDNSAMDGWVIKFSDLKNNRISFDDKEFKAGDPQGILSLKKASRIYTGAILPERADTVVEKEIVKVDDNSLIIEKEIQKGRNVRKASEDIRQGDIVLEKGGTVTPYNLNLLISTGNYKIRCFKKISVSIVSTGNELKEPGDDILPHEIYDSNSHTVKALLDSMGIDEINIFKCKDSLPETIDTIKKALESDVVLTIGGVSMGDYDFIRPALKRLDAKKIFWKIAMKPGRPFGFFRTENNYIFTLPGNPVSSIVCFEVFLRDALNHIMGTKLCYKNMKKAKALFDWNSKDNRIEFVRGIINDDDNLKEINIAGYTQQSNMLKELSMSNCLVKVQDGCIREGDIVEYIPLSK